MQALCGSEVSLYIDIVGHCLYSCDVYMPCAPLDVYMPCAPLLYVDGRSVKIDKPDTWIGSFKAHWNIKVIQSENEHMTILNAHDEDFQISRSKLCIYG